MRSFLTLLRRELSSVFLSPVAYVTMALFTSAACFTFLMSIKDHTGRAVYPEQLLFNLVLFWMLILIIVICMRLFAEEKRSGTIETLMTTAVGETAVVLAKYAGALIFCWVTITPSIGALYVLAAMSPGIEGVDGYAVAGGCAILALASICCTAVGVLISLLTRNQIVAAFCCFWAFCVPFMVKPFMRAVPLFRQATIERFSLEHHISLFVSGTLSLQPAVLYLSIAVLMLFTAIRVLESRRWL